MKNLIVTLTGPSGSGKTTLQTALCNSQRGLFTQLMSTTTRGRRADEPDTAYHFVTKDEFLSLKDTGALVESIEFDGNLYGLAANDVHDAFATNKVPVIVVEPGGREQISQWCTANGVLLLSAFIDCPMHVRLARLMSRPSRITHTLYNENWLAFNTSGEMLYDMYQPILSDATVGFSVSYAVTSIERSVQLLRAPCL